jgi:hypothetical protein
MLRTCKGCEGFIPSTRPQQARFCTDGCGSRFRNRDHYARKSAPERKALCAKRNKKFRATPYGRWSDHKTRARQSGIPFYLTFSQWWLLWRPHWEERGLGQKVMCRTKDTGPYAVGNVRIDSQRNNNREARGLPLLCES